MQQIRVVTFKRSVRFAEKECTWGNFLGDGNSLYYVRNKGSG